MGALCKIKNHRINRVELYAGIYDFMISFLRPKKGIRMPS